MEVGFKHGALCDSYEKQANAQGFTLGDKAELFDDVSFAYNLLRVHGYLTNSQVDMICNKIQKQLVKNLKPLGDKNESLDHKICADGWDYMRGRKRDVWRHLGKR